MSTDVIFGSVKRFSRQDGYGFAAPLLKGPHRIIGNATTVMIYAPGCRTFAGTPEEPQITNKPAGSGWATKTVVPAHGPEGQRHDYSFVALGDLQRTSKGVRANTWALVPKRATLSDVLAYGGLDYYVGKEVSVASTAKESPDSAVGKLVTWSLADNKFDLTLSVKSDLGQVVVSHEVAFTQLKVGNDTPDKLELLLTQPSGSVTTVTCLRRPPL